MHVSLSAYVTDSRGNYCRMPKSGIYMDYDVTFLFDILIFLYLIEILREPFYECRTKCEYKRLQKE